MDTNLLFWSYLTQFFLKRENFRQICRENQNTFYVTVFFFSKILPFMR